jgi:YVTN family beta-propeller protein
LLTSRAVSSNATQTPFRFRLRLLVGSFEEASHGSTGPERESVGRGYVKAPELVRRFRFVVAVAVLAGVCLMVGASSAGASAVVNTIPVAPVDTVESELLGLSSDGTHVWVTNAIGDTVSEIDASSGTVVNTIPVGA